MAYRERIRSRAATPGEVKTLEYLTDAFHRLGLEPAAGSSYLQPAPLVEITASAERALEWGRKQQEEYTAERYHKPSDEYCSGVDLRGSLEDLQLLYAVGARLAAEKTFPAWSRDSEFRAVRERSRAAMR